MSDPVSVTYVLISISMRYSLRGGRRLEAAAPKR